MSQEIGEAREAWGWDVMRLVEDFANKTKGDVKPFYIVYACKRDTAFQGVYRQTVKAYYQKPPKMLGILVWYVDHSKSEFRFCPELSAPPDVPLDPKLLSDKASDASTRVMEQGKAVNALVS